MLGLKQSTLTPLRSHFSQDTIKGYIDEDFSFGTSQKAFPIHFLMNPFHSEDTSLEQEWCSDYFMVWCGVVWCAHPGSQTLAMSEMCPLTTNIKVCIPVLLQEHTVVHCGISGGHLLSFTMHSV